MSLKNTENLLFELGTEELPSQYIKQIVNNLLHNVINMINKFKINYESTQYYASPRRIAFIINNINILQQDIIITKKGPFIRDIYDDNGNMNTVGLGFAKANNIDIKKMIIINDKKGKRLSYIIKKKGNKTIDLLHHIITNAVKKLKLPKTMYWGEGNESFVRPVRWGMVIFGSNVIPITLFGLLMSNITYGHRVHDNNKAITIAHADEYITKLKNSYVIVDWEERKKTIVNQINNIINNFYIPNIQIIDHDKLIEEITGIVEWPSAIICKFDKKFLKLPKEIIISIMHKYQKCFPIIDTTTNQLINYFIVICNIEIKNYKTLVLGYNKVMEARLFDAHFFYTNDIRITLNEYNIKLKNVLFQEKLGSMYDRVLRITKLSIKIGIIFKVNIRLLKRASLLSKCDLMTNIVCEFPHLEGIIGKYLAKYHHEDPEIYDAIEEQYWPKFSGDKVPINKISQCLALAEKMDILISFFSILNKPFNSDKDPFALRRTAIGIIRIIKETTINISLDLLINMSISTFKINMIISSSSYLKSLVLNFLINRFQHLLANENIPKNIINAVFILENKNVQDINNRINALMKFKQENNFQKLVMNYKRIKNFLSKHNYNFNKKNVDKMLLEQFAEQHLCTIYEVINNKMVLHNNHYYEHLKNLSLLYEPINLFFKNIKIVDNKQLINNRLILLHNIYLIMNHVCDFNHI